MIINTDQTSYLGQFINNAIPGTSTSSDDSNSTDAAATTTVMSTITATPSSDSSNTTTVVGAAVGAVLGVACIIALAGLIWMMRKVKSLKKEMQNLRSSESYSSAPMTQQPYNPPQNAAPPVHTYEADWDNGRYEIDSTGK
jgi:beta-lactamase regulating signal transducer with metallopeptidase domain